MKPGLLPPLPLLPGQITLDDMRGYATLAVREALVRAAQKCEQQDYAEDCANAIRALAKKYE